MNSSIRFQNSDETRDGIKNLRFLKSSLVCPKCKNNLLHRDNYIRCDICKENFPQFDENWTNLFSNSLLEADKQWFSRQQEMEIWYQDLIASPGQASYCLLSDYTPFQSILNSLSGKVLDIGGGVGLVRHYLPSSTQYIVIDPSLDWLKTEWKTLSDVFPCLDSPPSFVRGIGEYLPFLDCSFDVVLSFWSINHSSNPEQVFKEIVRVLRPGGKLFIVLEDMEPLWFDMIDKDFPAEEVFLGFFGADKESLRFPRLKLISRLLLGSDFPLQNDHIRIQENKIFEWTQNSLERVKRSWIGQFLTLEFKKNSAPKRI